MMWFCGGHGTCLTGAGPAGHIEQAVVAWLKRYVGKDAHGRHRPGVRVARRRRPVALDRRLPDRQGRADHRHRQRHARRSRPPTPPPAARSPPAARANALNVRRHRARRARSSASRSSPSPTPGTGTATHVFAQIVDEARDVVVGNQATPIPLTLDGQPHTISPPAGGDRRRRPRARSTRCSSPAARSSTARSAAPRALNFTKVDLSLPTVGANAISGGAGILAADPHLPLPPQVHASA